MRECHSLGGNLSSPSIHFTREDISDPMFVVSHTGKLFLLLGPHMLLSVLISHIAEGSMIKAVADIYAGCQPDWMACLKLGVRKALPTMMTFPPGEGGRSGWYLS
jgi:hypothetical protein